jgi:hypothetical protein
MAEELLKGQRDVKYLIAIPVGIREKVLDQKQNADKLNQYLKDLPQRG